MLNTTTDIERLIQCNCSGQSIAIKDLTVSINATTILENVSLKVPSCQITSLVGPSGAGKSTLLSLINRTSDTNPKLKAEGAIQIGDINTLDKNAPLDTLRSKVGMLFQKPTPFSVSIQKNIEIPLKYHSKRLKLSSQDILNIMQDSLQKVGLWNEVKDRLKQPATRLSGGQQQRLCLARALALNPDILLLDEPCSALDPLSIEKIESVLHDLKDKKTILMVTHNLAQAKRLSDRVALMWNLGSGGEVLENTSTNDFFNSPKSKQALAYIDGTLG